MGGTLDVTGGPLVDTTGPGVAEGLRLTQEESFHSNVVTNYSLRPCHVRTADDGISNVPNCQASLWAFVREVKQSSFSFFQDKSQSLTL